MGTKTITVKSDSVKLTELCSALKKRKQQQLKSLKETNKCMFRIKL